MNEELIMLDTNIVIYALNNNANVYSFVNRKKLVVTFVTEIELLGWNGITPNDKELLELFLQECLYVDYNKQIRQRTIDVKSSYNLKLGDAFIAAAAIEFDIHLISADKVFKRVKELTFTHITPSK